MSTTTQPAKRLNATLPESLARHVAEMTGDGGLYETPSEFVRDLIRRDMEKMAASERHAINSLLRQALAENSYSPRTDETAKEIRRLIAS
jgi:Arc/MetJ-type ribon-helix-helix transcriptional regulator